jgi:NRPS condensation-like uncharacterized protein
MRRHGEMVIQLELALEGHLRQDVLERACALVLDVHPVLGCRLAVEQPTPQWRRLPEAQRAVLTVVRHAADYETARTSGLDAIRGAQFAVCLWPGVTGDRLLVKMTHEAGDGVGLQVLARDLGSLYSALEDDRDFRPARGRAPSRDAADILFGHVSRCAMGRTLWDFARFFAPRVFPRRTHALPMPQESRGPWIPVVRRLPEPGLAVLKRHGNARGATLNDLFLAAAYRALAFQGRWTGTSALRIGISVDLRRWCLPSTHDPAICNLSSLEIPFLVRDLGRSFDETLANVSAIMRRRKASRPGLALALIFHVLARGKPPPDLRGASATRRDPGTGLDRQQPIILSNEGALVASRLRFGRQQPAAAHILPPFWEPPHVHVCISSYEGALTLAAVTRENAAPLVARFLDAVIDELPVAGRDVCRTN